MRTPDRILRANVTATDDPREAGVQDVVVVTLKAPSLPRVVEAMQPLLGPETPVVFATNGVPWWWFHGVEGPFAERRITRLDPEGALWDRLPIGRAIGGVVYSANEIESPGVVRNASPERNRLLIGEPAGEQVGGERVARLAEILTGDGLETVVTPNLRGEVWRKLLGNIAFNPTAAVVGGGLDVIGKDPALREVVRRVLMEGVAIGHALGLDFDDDVDARMAGVKGDSTHRPSMLQDFDLGRTPELDAIVLAVQDLARDLGIATPALDTLAALAVGRARVLGIGESQPAAP